MYIPRLVTLAQRAITLSSLLPVFIASLAPTLQPVEIDIWCAQPHQKTRYASARRFHVQVSHSTLRHGGFHSSFRLDQPGTATRSDGIEADGAALKVGQDEHHVRLVAIVRLAVQLGEIA